MTVTRYKRTRYWAVYDACGDLIALCVYRKGAREVVARLLAAGPPSRCLPSKEAIPAE